MENKSIYEKYHRIISQIMNPHAVMENLLSKGHFNEFEKNNFLEIESTSDRNLYLIDLLETNHMGEELFFTALKETKCVQHEELLKILNKESSSHLKTVVNDVEKILTTIEDEKENIRRLKEKVNQLLKERDELREKLKEKEEERNDNSEQTGFLKIRIEDLEREIRELEKQISTSVEKGSMYKKFDKEIVNMMNPQTVMDKLLQRGIIIVFQQNKVLESKSTLDKNRTLIRMLDKNAVDEELFLTALKEAQCKEHEELVKLLRPENSSHLKCVVDDHEKRLRAIEDEKEDARRNEKVNQLSKERDELKEKLKEKEEKLKENSELIGFLKKRIEALEREKNDLEKQIDSAHAKIQAMEEKHQLDMEAMQRQIGEIRQQTEAMTNTTDKQKQPSRKIMKTKKDLQRTPISRQTMKLSTVYVTPVGNPPTK